MVKSGRLKILILGIAVASLVLAASGYITPVDWYTTDKSKALGRDHSSKLEAALNELTSVYGREELRVVTVDESVVGGAGFWKNPAKFETDMRYMSLVIMAKTPPYIFGTDRNGRVASVLDRYGKSMISALTKQMEAVGDVDGIMIGVVWGDNVNGNPTEVGSEALALFLAREDVILYKNFKLTIERLVNRNDLFLFKGSSEIDNFLQFILES